MDAVLLKGTRLFSSAGGDDDDDVDDDDDDNDDDDDVVGDHDDWKRDGDNSWIQSC